MSRMALGALLSHFFYLFSPRISLYLFITLFIIWDCGWSSFQPSLLRFVFKF
ncbi:hypothetical protein ACE6H2_028538 [Prunus campanulata]